MEIPGLSCSFVRNPETRARSTSEVEPTNSGEMYDVSPFGVQATKNLPVSWCLYWFQIDDCICRSDGVSIKILLLSIIANVE